jgi:hypothetical protein
LLICCRELLLVGTYLSDVHSYVGKESPNLSTEQRARVDEILRFSKRSENAEQMVFESIVCNSALRERFGYPIPANKVMWDCQGNPKMAGQGNPKKAGRGNPKKAGQGNPNKAGSSSGPSKKSRAAHKNMGTSSQAGADPISLAAVVEEGPSGPKRKSGEGPSEPPTKKG